MNIISLKDITRIINYRDDKTRLSDEKLFSKEFYDVRNRDGIEV